MPKSKKQRTVAPRSTTLRNNSAKGSNASKVGAKGKASAARDSEELEACDPEQEYEIESVLGAMVVRRQGRLQWWYHVSWEGKPSEKSWEPKSSFLDVGPPVLTIFWRAINDLSDINERVAGYSVESPIWWLEEGEEFYEHWEAVMLQDDELPMADEPALPN